MEFGSIASLFCCHTQTYNNNYYLNLFRRFIFKK